MAILNDLLVRGATRCLNTLYTNSLQTDSQTISGDLTVNGYTYMGYSTSRNDTKLSVAGISNNQWYRSSGAVGWYSDTYGGGIYMTDTTYVKTYNNKALYSYNGLYTGSSQQYYLNLNGKLNAVDGIFSNNVNVGVSLVSRNITATNVLRAAKYDLQTITQMGTNGTLYVAPSIQFPTTNTTSVTTTSTSITIIDTNITSTTLAGVVWAANAKVKISGTINGVTTGTVDGKITSINTSSKTMVIGNLSGGNWSEVVAGTYTKDKIENLNIMMYETYQNSANYPVGILLTSYGAVTEHTDGTAKTYIDIYSGGTTTKPVVRIGNMTGLDAINGVTPSGWGLYTNNGYFSGLIVSDSGKIGGWSLGTNSLTTGTWGSSGSAMLCTGSSSSKSIGGSSSISGWAFTAGANFGVTTNGDLYANSAHIKGDIEADSLTLGSGVTIGISQVANLQTTLNGKQPTGDYATNTNLNAVSDVANSALSQSVWYATCSTAAATTAKVATISPTTTAFTLTTGVIVNVKFSIENSGAVGSITLNVNNTGAKNIKYIYNGSLSNIPAANYLKANQMYQFQYDGTYWVVTLNYNTNTNTIGSYGNGAVKAGTNGIFNYSLIMRTGTDTWESLTLSAGTGTSKAKNTSGFYIDKILYVSANVTYTSGNSTTSEVYSSLSIDLRYSTNCNTTLTTGLPVYIVGTMTNGLFYLDDTWWTQTIPTTNDGKYYIYIGSAYSTYQIRFCGGDSAIYIYRNSEFQRLEATTATSYITNIDSNNGITVKALNGTTGTTLATDNYIKLNSDGLEIFKSGNSIAQYGDTARIGKTDGNNLLINTNGIIIKKDTKELAKFSPDGVEIGSSDIGKIELSIDEMRVVTFEGNSIFSVDSSGAAESTYVKKIINTDRFLVAYSPDGVYSTYRIIDLGLKNPIAGGALKVYIYVYYYDSNRYRYESYRLTTDFVIGTKKVININAHGVNLRIHYCDSSQRASGQSLLVIYHYRTTTDNLYYSVGMAFYDATINLPSYDLGTRYNTENDSGAFSTIIGEMLIASGSRQLAIGKYNIEDTNNTYAFIIGNGTDNDTRSNALTVDWDGVVSASKSLRIPSYQDGDSGIFLANTSDYPTAPSENNKRNGIYANVYNNIMNTYYTAQGYHAFYADGTGQLYIYNDNVLVKGSFNAVGTITQNGTAVSLNGHTHTLASLGAAASGHKHSASDITSGGTIEGSVTVSGNLAVTGEMRVAGAKKMFYTKAFSYDNLSASAGGTVGTQSKSISVTGYTPIAVCGTNLTNASSSGTNASWCNTYSCYIDGNNLKFNIRNLNTSSAAKVKLEVDIFYIATTAI